MTDAAFLPTRSLRALAVTGALGLLMSPMMAATAAYAAPGTVKILEPGTAQEVKANDPHVNGCSFDIRLDGVEAGTDYAVTIAGQSPTPEIPEVQGQAVLTVPAGQTSVSGHYTLLPTDAVKPHPQQGFHLKAQATHGEDKISSKVFWVVCGVQPPSGQNGTPAPQSSASGTPKPSAEASVPGMVNAGIDGGNDGLVALGVGGAAVASLAALGLRRRTRR